MSVAVLKRRDGFEGQKFVNIPSKVWKDIFKKDPHFFQLYITHMGYFPRASFHYRERRKGCDDNILIYCVQGKGYFIIGDKRYVVNANQYIIVAATDEYMRYWADSETPWTIYWVHFTGNDIHNFNRFLGINNNSGAVSIPFNNKGLDIWTDIYNTLEHGFSNENLCNAIFSLYNLLATFIYPDKHGSPEHIDESRDIVAQTITYMRDNVDKKLTVDDMASQHSLSSSYFSILFRKATGMPPIDYFINLKMQRACQLLYSEDTKIKSVAISLGYDDQYYFSRIFKKFMGSSPEQYRSLAKR